jgi:hypothetical protein
MRRGRSRNGFIMRGARLPSELRLPALRGARHVVAFRRKDEDDLLSSFRDFLALLLRSSCEGRCFVIMFPSSTAPWASRQPPYNGASQRDPHGDKGVGEVTLRPQRRPGRPNAPLGS